MIKFMQLARAAGSGAKARRRQQRGQRLATLAADGPHLCAIEFLANNESK